MPSHVVDKQFDEGISGQKWTFNSCGATEGKEFILAFMQQYGNGGRITLYVGAFKNSTVRIEAPYLGLHQTYAISTGINKIPIDTSIRNIGTGVFNKGVYVQSEENIAVHMVDNIIHSTDGYMALPLDVLSTMYYVVSYTVTIGPSEFVIAAPYANTNVSVELRMTGHITYNGNVYYSGESIHISLGRFQTFQLQHTYDLTGSKVTSDKPVAVFSGSACEDVPSQYTACDILVEQMIPVSSFGTEFIVSAFYPFTKYIIRVLADHNDTQVTVLGDGTFILSEGRFLERDIHRSPLYVTSSKPVLLLQYAEGQDAEPSAGQGDPFMVTVPSISQFAVDYTFSVFNFSFFDNYLILTVPTALASGLRLDGNPFLSQRSYNITLSGSNKPYTVLYVKLPRDSIHIQHYRGDVKFGALIYGFYEYDSYGYPLGLGLEKKTGPEIRLVNGSSRLDGRLEVLYGKWGTVCDDRFDLLDGYVICRMMGFLFGPANVSVYGGAHYGQGTGPIIIDDLECQGNETDLYTCHSRPWLSSNCVHQQDVGVDCGSNVRLTGGHDKSQGRLEILHSGQWGTVCNSSFDQKDVQVICNMLGFNSSGSFYHNRNISDMASGRIWLSDLACTGSEEDIGLCMTKNWGHNNCSHVEDVYIKCTDIQVRLVDGMSPYEGRLEVLYQGSWGTICDNNFDETDALVACRMLNFPHWAGNATYHGNAFYGQGSGGTVIDNLMCDGRETDISECPSNPWLVTSCRHTQDTGINCHTHVRLVDGGRPSEGRVEVFANGRWGTICDDNFDDGAALVICRMLGYEYKYRGYSSSNFTHGTGQIWLDEFSCTGNESDITECMRYDWGHSDCGHGEDIGIYCGSAPNECLSNPCTNGGTCIETGHGPRCQCPHGLTGTNCSKFVDLCASRPCQNGALCINWAGFFECRCTRGWYGDLCNSRQCRSKQADILFVLDASVSQRKDFFLKELDFVLEFIDHVTIGPSDVRVSLMQFSFHPHVEFYLNQYLDKYSLRLAINNVTYKAGTTHLADALIAAPNVFSVANGGGPRTNHKSAEKFVIVLSDGTSINSTAVIHAADSLKNEVNAVFVVGIGPSVNHNGLLSIASRPDNYSPINVFSSSNMNIIYPVVKRLTCDVCHILSVSDIALMVDASASASSSEFHQSLNVINDILNLIKTQNDLRHTHVAGFSFANRVYREFEFGSFSTISALQLAIQQIPYRGFGTAYTSDLAKVLQYAQTSVFDQSHGGRTIARKYLVVFSNGQLEGPNNEHILEEKLNLERANVTIIAVGVGDGVDTEALSMFASSPYYTFHIKDISHVSALEVLKSEFAYGVCA